MGPTDLVRSVVLCIDNYFKAKEALIHHSGCKKEPIYLSHFLASIASEGGKLLLLRSTESMK